MQEAIDPKFLLPDVLWEKIKPIIPPRPPKKKPGRTRMDDKKAMNAIYYFLRTGLDGALFLGIWAPKALSTIVCLFGLKKDCFLPGNRVSWSMIFSKALIGSGKDGCHVQAPLAGENTGPSYKHGGKSGSNRSLLTDGEGIPLALYLDSANCPDMKVAEPTLNSFVVPRPDPVLVTQNLCLDKGYDYPEIDVLLSIFRYVSHIRRKGEEAFAPDPLLPKFRARRWVVERTHSWMNRFRRLLVRWEKLASHYLALLHFSCAYITWHRAGLF